MQLLEDLKHLYVALTRARRRVIMFDQSDVRCAAIPHTGRPMLGLAPYGSPLAHTHTVSAIGVSNRWCWPGRIPFFEMCERRGLGVTADVQDLSAGSRGGNSSEYVLLHIDSLWVNIGHERGAV